MSGEKMSKTQKYSLELKFQVIEKYEPLKYGYKKLAKEFNLSRDTVRAWCLNQKLREALELSKNQNQ